MFDWLSKRRVTVLCEWGLPKVPLQKHFPAAHGQSCNLHLDSALEKTLYTRNAHGRQSCAPA